jgi:hypothetical protein
LGNGDGTFQPPLFYAVGDSPTFAATGTFTKDGGRDVVVVNHSANTVSTLLSTPEAALSTPSVTYGGTEVGTSGASFGVTLTNPGTAQMNLGGILMSGDFAQTSTCGTILMPGMNCTATVTFTPTQKGTRNGSLTFTDNAPPGAQMVGLAGTGLASGAYFTPTSLAFGSQASGTTSAAKTVTLSDTGDTPLTISSIATAAPFAQTNTCGSFVNAGATCTISVTFKPTSATAYTGVLSIMDNAGMGQQNVSLSGTGDAPATAQPSTVMVGAPSVAAGATSAANSPAWSAPPSNASLATSGAGVNTGDALSASSSDDAASSASQEMQPRPEPVVTLSTQAMPFAKQRLHSTSAARTLTLTNTGNALLEVRAISSRTPDFAQTNDCGASLAAGANCTIRITFAPQQAGHIEGYVEIDAGTQGPQKVLVFGEGTPEASVAKTDSPGQQAPGSKSTK